MPEVWRCRVNRSTLDFLHLVESRYEPIEQSLALPGLTPAMVLEALALGKDLIESDWLLLLPDWVARTLPPVADQG